MAIPHFRSGGLLAANLMTLPNKTIFNFYEGTETSKYTELNSTTLNTAPNQLLENDKYLDQEVQSLKESVEGGEIQIQPSQLPKASETEQGIIEVATQEEVSEGRSNTTAVTPAYNKAFVDTQVNRFKQEVKDEALEEIGSVVDEKIEAAIDEAQGEIDNKIDQTIQDKIESGEIGGGGGSGDSSLVVKPEIITPTEGAINVASLPTLQASAFKCLLATETRLHREFELNTVSPDASVLTKQVNADSITLDSRLNPSTQYKWRCRDVTNNGLKSAWTAWTNFTTAEGQTVNTPTITLKGYQNSPTDILSGLTIEGSAFTVSDGGEDTHKATSWSIAKKDGVRANVWESLNDTTHKTSITVPDSTLEKGTAYTLTVIYHGTAAYDSAPAIKDFTTSDDFGTVNVPVLSVEGAPNDVYETPTLTAGAFSNTRDTDTHELTDWEILPQAGGAAVWQSLNDATNKTTIKVPKGRLAVSTAYTARVRYKGLRYGWSDWRSVQFNTVAVFATVDTPTLTVEGTPNDVPKSPTLTLSNFSGTNVTHASTNWKIVKVQDSSEVWTASNNSNTIVVPAGKLEVATKYKFMGQYVANEGVSSTWAETIGTTKDTFTIVDNIGSVSDGTFGVGVAPKEVYESLGLSPLPGTEDPKSFQYGLYEIVLPEEVKEDYPYNDGKARRQCKAYVKYIPKFYYAFLTNYTTGKLMSEETLKEYEKYSGVSLALLKQAQERSPNHAIVIAPGSAFTSQEEANEHGFILHRAFIDGGKEKPGFFIANSLLYYSASTNSLNTDTKYYFYFGAKELNYYEYDLTESHEQGIVRAGSNVPWIHYVLDRPSHLAIDNLPTLCRKFSGFNLASAFMWSAISMLSFAAGLYCKDATECAWYTDSGNIGPRGLNSTTKDIDDPTVTFPAMSGDVGTPFPSDLEQYAKTTHNGTISGITNVNGWLDQPLLGVHGSYTRRVMPESIVLANITRAGDEVDNGETFERGDEWKSWGQLTTDHQSSTWFTQVSGAERAMCGVMPIAKAHPIPETSTEERLFGSDVSSGYDPNSFSTAGSSWEYGKSAGIFSRSSAGGDLYPNYNRYGVRLGGYPKDSSIPINDIGKPNSPTFGVGIPSDEEAEAFIPGMIKHPDFYDETKPGYGSWILPTKSYSTTTFGGVLKYIPKFYWHPLFKGDGGPSLLLSDREIEALVPYVSVTKEQMIRVRDKYPYSGMVFASASAFANESEANAQGFILPAAFIDGGKEKNGFFIAPTLTTLASDPSRDADILFGETYSKTPVNANLWRLYTNPTQQGLALPPSTTNRVKDAIALPRWYSSTLCCETIYTVAALALISLCAAQYATSTTECAWYDPNGVTNFPKGINNNSADIDDPSVAVATAMDDEQGSVFPTTQEGYCKTTHNGRITGITHVNGWLWRPMVGYGYLPNRGDRLFDCTKHSISEITVDNVESDTTMFVSVTEPRGGSWSEESATPLYTNASGQARLLNCVYSHSSGSTSATFGNDRHKQPYLDRIVYCGGDWDDGSGAGVFRRYNTYYGGSEDYDSWGYDGSYTKGFRVIGYSPLNADGTTGGGNKHSRR